MCSTTPARLVGLKNKGDIIVGYDADLVIFDPNHEIVLSPESLHENVDWTPYDGFKMSGWPSTTISRGEVIVEGEDFLGLPGRGRYAKRQLPA